MTPDTPDRTAEVLRLAYIEGLHLGFCVRGGGTTRSCQLRSAGDPEDPGEPNNNQT